jgi:U4/U6 small nuclear ribonucleoprotein PRP31
LTIFILLVVLIIIFYFRQVVSENELEKIFEGCDMALELYELKLKIYEYVESRMQFIAPNMSTIVGAATAAKLMGKI